MGFFDFLRRRRITYQTLDSICSQQELAERVTSALQPTGTQERIMSAAAGSRAQYVHNYLSRPLETIKEENRALGRIITQILAESESNEIGLPRIGENEFLQYLLSKHGIKRDGDTTHFKITEAMQMASNPDEAKCFVLEEAIKLHAAIELLVNPAKEEKNPETYDELRGVGFLCEGDYLPGRNFVLGKPETYIREKIVLHKASDGILPLLAAAKALGLSQNPEAFINDIFAMLKAKFPGEGSFVPGKTMSLGQFVDTGGVCRHKAGVLQVCLQEAGIKSVYIQGRVAGGGLHAWVEVDDTRDRTYSLVLDPEIEGGLIGRKQEVKLKDDGYACFLERCFYNIPKELNKVWRAKHF